MRHPRKVYSRSNPDASEIKLLLSCISACEPDGVACRLFTDRAKEKPVRRLAINLQSTLGLMALVEITDILTDGMAGVEIAALFQLEDIGCPETLLEIAHGLLNVHERWILLKSMSRKFREASSQPHGVFEYRLLDRVLGQEL